ncbi:Hypothetical protein PHPALM_11183, partial [Phytophthora palmivora]
EAYHARVKGALKPFQLDQGDFRNTTSLLVFTNALDPDQKPENRLTDEALALVRRDVCSKEDPDKGRWVGDRLSGVWYKLIHCSRIEKLEQEIKKKVKAGTYKPSSIPPFSAKEESVPGFTRWIRPDGSHTAEMATPLRGVRGKRGSEESESGGESGFEEDDLDEEKPPAPAKFALA